MMDRTSPESVGRRAVQALGPEVRLVSDLDSAGLGRSLAKVAISSARNPVGTWLVALRWATRMMSATAQATAKLATPAQPAASAARPKVKDRRFADPAWEQHPYFYWVRQSYLASSEALEGLVRQADIDPVTRGKAEFATSFVVDAMAPTNFLLTNPTALKRAYETNGVSLLRGLRNFVHDLATNRGRPSQVDTRPFKVGGNLANTPGKVVFRNHLMELIQYAPQTETVHKVPLLISPPWINKYYILDLSPGRSVIEWAVQHGHTVFTISYRNPDNTMSNVGLEDYLLHGPRVALDVVADITGQDKVNIVGLCLGGALTSMLAAYLSDVGDDRLNSITLINTLLDYSEPGPLAVFTDKETVQRIERRVLRAGFMETDQMMGAFNVLRPNDLIFNYVTNNWLLGEDPPAFDILAWNADGTRLPAAMHTFYLRGLYLENLLARGELVLAGHRLNLENVQQDMYLVAAENDHIVPWRSAYRTTQLVGGHSDFVLTSGGHIAGIVNPPSPKARYWVASTTPSQAEDWQKQAEKHQGSWWEHWADWIAERAGEQVEPPPMGSESHPPLEDAPGRYVSERPNAAPTSQPPALDMTA